jgi:hypothetical protein
MSVMAVIAIGLDCISIGIVIKLIAISSDYASMDVNGGFDSGFDSGFDGQFNSGLNGWFHLAVLGY